MHFTPEAFGDSLNTMTWGDVAHAKITQIKFNKFDQDKVQGLGWSWVPKLSSSSRFWNDKCDPITEQG